jgi:ATP-binding cassette subfamily F protein 3
VVAGYFTQDGSDLDPEQSPLVTLVYDDDLKPAEARNLLARFLLTGDDVYRPVKTLSGGEKNKLSLARLTNLNPNLLVLDEPTNHLDMASREALADVLREYKGTLLLVSHDRWLLSQIADHVLDVRKAGPITYEGGFDDYRRGKKVAPVAPTKKADPGIPKLLDGKTKPPEPELSPRELSKEIERVQKLVNRLEEDVANLEDDIKEIEQKLANLPPTADVFALSREYQVTKEELEGAMSTWEEQAANLERLIARRTSSGN